jgi:hypothetical protein
MENKPTEVAEAEATAPVEESAESSSTNEENTSTEGEDTANAGSDASEEDLSSLIEAEKQGGQPDPEKAKQRFEEKRRRETSTDTEDDYEDEGEKPLTRAEIEEMLNRTRQQVFNEANQDRLIEISAELAEGEQEAELIRTIHANRTFPDGMGLRDQLAEAKAIASYKREQAKTAELARKVQSQQTTARSTAVSHRDAQSKPEPQLATDKKESLKRAGYEYNEQNRRYEKKMPNGKMLVTNGNDKPQLLN